MARISKSMLSKSGNSGHPCLVPEFRMPSAFLSCFHISDKDVNCRFVMYGLYYVEVSFLYVHFLEFFFFLSYIGVGFYIKNVSAFMEIIT